MNVSEIRIKRRDLMTADGVAALLRSLAEQVEAGHGFTLDNLPITLDNQVMVRQEYKKESGRHQFSLKLSWEESYPDQMKLSDEEDESDVLGDGLHTPPLDLPPGSEDSLRLRE